MRGKSSLVFLDTETDCVSPRRQVWDVGMIIYDEEGNRTEYSALVEDVDLRDGNRHALNIGHFATRHPYAGAVPEEGTRLLPEATVARDVFRLTYNATIYAHVGKFDEHALRGMLARHGLTWGGHHDVQDVVHYAAAALRIHCLYQPELAEAHAGVLRKLLSAPWRCDVADIVAAYGIPPLPDEQLHTAIGDCRLHEQIWLASMVVGITPRPDDLWAPPHAIEDEVRAALTPRFIDVSVTR